MRPLLTALGVLLLLLIDTLLMIVPLLLLALLRLLLPGRRLRAACGRGVMWCAERWVTIGKRIFARLLPTVWDIRGSAGLRRDRSYLLVCNHQSWVDIPALLEAFSGRVPFFKFFLKQELIWIPLLGLAFWALDYPFMKRHSKAYLERHPEKRGEDLEITRRACARFRDIPVTLVNYLEGTRFTPLKHQQQASPYRYLLRPKAGGVAFALASLGPRLDALLDVTLVYPGRRIPGFWLLISGQVARVIVDIQTRELDPRLWQGDYQDDAQFRQYVQDWVSRLWEEKDARIARLRGTP
ncbi:acyltransferase [Azotobacter beijerinckii]|uniref:1-acyl-sn-glycerol-3-phosphate acyltransferase n=1 Tax=Azotobacter beijerinckii TaxID=170623 RepID=A0A1I4E693_9GAMM|nr:acyltransferase [Azotobacter beijerinckii]SFB46983.1 1-acyl-sn-glycerol-3-phosphate acyltransferase [Azotobacter beijerinckii]SFL01282.1 1-acyl-sn-glycerol-3-phosphate acyltransferase [Azotobacter beijerinckii]